ncbi:MCE family protein [Angustibacter sp. McL0619]|uniref:MCE family protein n=1 Tax=Angustibacter sp. McL0619 TaxID=3415676 RepID=UPI003CF9B7AF
MAIPFRERNPVPIGAVGLLLIGALLIAAFNVQKLPLLGRGDTYRAAFTEVGGLKTGDDVMVAGVKVGKVKKIELDGAQVLISFKVTEPAHFGTRTGAAVKLKTLLGQKYLALDPQGPGQLKTGSLIPTSRTVPSYDVIDAFSDLTTTTEAIDVPQLSKSLDVLATEFKDSPPQVKASLEGLTRLSRTISSRDQQLAELLAHAKDVSGTVAARNGEVQSLIKDGDLLLVELQKRRAAIHTLLTNTAALAAQITGLVRDNRAQLKPALTELQGVLATLRKHQDDLDAGIKAMAPFTRVFANTLGNGRWFDTYIPNLVPIGGTIPGGAR